jgi:hypothetical protein
MNTECVWISILSKCISYATTQYKVENDVCNVLRSCFLLTEVVTGATLGRSIVLQSVLEWKEAGSTADRNQIAISIDSLWDLVNIPARRTINWRRKTEEFCPLFPCIGGIVALSRKNNCFLGSTHSHLLLNSFTSFWRYEILEVIVCWLRKWANLSSNELSKNEA